MGNTEFVVDSSEYANRVKELIRFYGFRKADILVDNDALYTNGVERQLSKLLDKTVWLKSGAYLYIEKTEAMTVIDINSGKNVGKKGQNALFEVNKEAAKEIVRQIQLRNIGGIIVIDFIDLKKIKDKNKILDILVTGFKDDKVRTMVLGMSRLGLVEISRQKRAYSIYEAFVSDCPKCKGLGFCLK